jgi:hypothetical protein
LFGSNKSGQVVSLAINVEAVIGSYELGDIDLRGKLFRTGSLGENIRDADRSATTQGYQSDAEGDPQNTIQGREKFQRD